MTKRSLARPVVAIAAGAVLATALTVACSGGGGGGTTTPSPTAATIGATVTITANGLSDAAPRINAGQKIRFTNNDSQPHQILTTPHLMHTDCPALNEVDVITPGQSRDSGALDQPRGCGFHDHMNPANNAFRGQVLVGLSASDPAPPPPAYVRP